MKNGYVPYDGFYNMYVTQYCVCGTHMREYNSMYIIQQLRLIDH
jgi:hypothetical protein